MRINQAPPILGILIYIVAVVAGFFLIGISTWGDMEADSYGFSRRSSATLSGLNCPILLTKDEPGEISLIVSNPTDKPLHPSVRMEISADLEPQVFVESLDLAPGQSKTLEWSLAPKNIVLGNFILANVQVYASYPIPNREKTCGILVIDLPATGKTIVPALAVFTIIGLAYGLYSMNKSDFRQRNAGYIWNAILLLTALIVGGILISFTGAWLPSVAILVGATLISLILINSTLLKQN